MAAVTYDKGTEHQFYLDDHTNRKSLKKAASKIDLKKNGCKTFTFDALREAREKYFTAKHGDRPKVMNIMMLVTDGITFPWDRQNETIEQARRLRNTGAVILVVALPNEFGLNNATEFEMIATPNSKIFRPRDFIELDMIMTSLKKALCRVHKTQDPTEPPRRPKRTFAPQEDENTPTPDTTIIGLPIPPRPTTGGTLCPYGFLEEGDKDSCQVFMVGCDVMNPRCCSCNLVFKDPSGRKNLIQRFADLKKREYLVTSPHVTLCICRAPDWPATLLRNDTCLCEACLTERCIPRKFLDEWRRERALAGL